MKVNYLVKTPVLPRERISVDQYTLSLLEEACRAGLIDRDKVDCFKHELLSLLSETILKYTRGDSTSVRTETAQRILLSLLYAVDAYTASVDEPEEALLTLQNSSVREIYERGLSLVTACLQESKRLYQNLIAKKLPFGTQAYHLTISEGLPEFFANYDPLFNAQDTMASIDYPVLGDDIRMNGVFYIKQYLDKLIIENNFCHLFCPQQAARVLNRYGQIYGLAYQDTLLNLFEVMLTNAIFSRLAGNRANQLDISVQQYELLEYSLQGHSPAHCASLISGAMEGLITELGIGAIQLIEQIRGFQPILMPRFVSALGNGTLKNVMIVNSPAKPGLDINFSAGRRMDDDEFRILVGEILACRRPAGKAAMMLAKVDSLEDFIDILEADCLGEDEFKLIYDTLGDLELSVLVKIAFVEEMRTADVAFSWSALADKQPDLEWQAALAQHLLTLNSARMDAIQGYLLAAWPEP